MPLRGLLVAPAQHADAAAAVVCVLVHPWGYLGGSQANMLPYAHQLAGSHGLECLLFNLRGVGDSGGRATLRCADEVDDVIGACEWVEANRAKHIVLVGASAGAAVAGSALDQVPAAKGLVAIGYTFGWCSSLVLGAHYAAVLASPKPKCFIMGTSDGFTRQVDCNDVSAQMCNVLPQRRPARISSAQHAACDDAAHAGRGPLHLGTQPLR